MIFSFLNFFRHPRGTLMLKKLIDCGFYPQIVIEEKSALAHKNRTTQYNDLNLDKAIEIDFEKLNIEHLIVKNHNSTTTINALKENKVDLIILGDCRIIKPNVFKIARLGTINVHPGYLPVVRGNTPYIWALYHSLPQGCSAHFIDEGIDTGPIIRREIINTDNISSYKELLIRLNNLCSEIIVDVLKSYKNTGIINSINQQDLLKKGDLKVHYFTLAPKEIKLKAIEKIYKT